MIRLFSRTARGCLPFLAATFLVLSAGVLRADTATHPIREFGSAFGPVSSAVFTPDGTEMLVGGTTGVSLWSATTGDKIREFSTQDDSDALCALSPDGSRVLTGTQLWDADTGELVSTFPGNNHQVTANVFSPDGSKILTVTMDQTVSIWDANTGDVLHVFLLESGPWNPIDSVAFSPDGSTFVAGRSDHTASLWNASTGELIRTFAGHTEAVFSVAFSPDGLQVLTGSADHTAVLWNANTGDLVRTFSGHTEAVCSVAFSPDGSRVLTAGDADRTARLWNPTTGETLRVFSGHDGAVKSAAFSADGARVLTGSSDQTVRVWDTTTGQTTSLFRGNTGWIGSAAFSPDDSMILTGSFDNTGRLWGTTGELIRIFSGHTGPVVSVAFSPSGLNVLTGSQDQTAILWDASNGNAIRTFSGHTSSIISVAFSPDGSTILTGSGDATACLWDTNSGNLLRTFADQASVMSAAFSHDGSKILIVSTGVAKLWDASTGVGIREFSEPTLSAAALSPDGSTVLTGSGVFLPPPWPIPFGAITVWDANTGEALRHYWPGTGTMWGAPICVAFSPDGSSFLAGSDSAAALWDLGTGDSIRDFGGALPPVPFSSDGSMVLTLSARGTAQLWESDLYTHRTFGFTGGNEDWTFNTIPSLFSAPTSDTIYGYLNITTTDNTNNFGWWMSPTMTLSTQSSPTGRTLLVPALDGTNVLAATFRVSTDAHSATAVPQFRLRAGSAAGDNQQDDVMTVESNADAAWSQAEDHTLLFRPPAASPAFNLDFDVLNFGAMDQPIATLGLDQVDISVVDPSTFETTPTIEAAFTFDTNADGWTPHTLPDVFTSPTLALLPGQLALTAVPSAGFEFGWWGSPETGDRAVTLRPDRLYYADFVISTDVADPLRVPGFRLRLNESDFRVSQMLNVNSTGPGTLAPTAIPRPYRVFFPAEVGVGRALILSADLATDPSTSDDSTTGSILLHGVTVYSVPAF